MTPAKTTRRHVTVAIVLVWLLVCGGLGWATRSAIQLDGIEAREDQRRADEVRMERALARMEAEIAPVLYPERARPYMHFRSYYIATEARYRNDSADASRDIVVASPLKDYRGPDWVLLHFQVSETEGWSSPQLTSEARFAMPAGGIPAPERPREATPENWFAALQERYSATMLEQALMETLIHSGQDEGLVAARMAAQNESMEDGLTVRTATAESARRAERLLQMQRQIYPASSCEPELVAMENLEAGAGQVLYNRESGACVQVYAPLMTPVWLDLTQDGEPMLALVRSASVETSKNCTLQGVLIDWPRLERDLADQVRDIFPDARLEPVLPGELANAGSVRGMLHTIPARLMAGTTPRVATWGLSSGLIGGLAVAWGATLLALFAITYGATKYLTLAERRMQFVAAVTHELRTPLTSFQLYSDLLGDMPQESPEKRRHYAGILRNEAARLARLVENVLSYSRVEDSAPNLRVSPTKPDAILQAAAVATAEPCQKAGKELIIEDHCPAETRIDTDSQFVVQILTNLIENACKYSADAADRRIWLSAAPGPGGSVTFEVDDAGFGVAPKDRRAIFEPFRRGTSEQGRKAGGVGLGLSLSKYWAQSLGGVLMLKRSSRNGTHYSCFSLTLPAATHRV